MVIQDLKKIEELRKVFRSKVGILRNELFEKKENGICFIFNRLSFNKIGCIKSINKSLNNGFSIEEHFNAAENILKYFLELEVIDKHYKNHGSNLKTIYLFVYKISENKYAYINLVTWGENEGYIDLYLTKEWK